MAYVYSRPDRGPRRRTDRVGVRAARAIDPQGKSSRGTRRRVLEYEWNVGPVPEMPHGEHAIFRYKLAPKGDATELVATSRRITAQTARGFLPGLHAFLDRLEAQLDTRVLP